MGLGYLKVGLYMGRQALPVANGRVLIKNGEGKALYDLTTDANGQAQTVPLTAPDKEFSRNPYTNMPRFSVVDIEVPSQMGYKKVIVHRAEIFDTITTTQSIHLQPLIPGETAEESVEVISAPIEHGVDLPRNAWERTDNHRDWSDGIHRNMRGFYGSSSEFLGSSGGNHGISNGNHGGSGELRGSGGGNHGSNDELRGSSGGNHGSSGELRGSVGGNHGSSGELRGSVGGNHGSSGELRGSVDRNHGSSSELRAMQLPDQISLANDVPIPEYITVHLGYPNEYARNVTLPFSDYIKNVASSEIYPTWDEAALYANILAQISFTLNRVFTLWYRSRRLEFDITNNTAFDQAFVEGRWIFENISQIVDGIFNNFIRRQGRQEPFFALYCNGTTSTCNGLSQWGSQFLAQQGFTPIQILRNYYPNDIQVVESNNFGDQIAVYPGVPLREGSTGESVRMLQSFLTRIHGSFPAIPPTAPDGIFGPITRESVIAFQRAFNLIPDGIVGKATWYAIVKIFVAVKELAELTSEGIRIGIGDTPPTVVLRMGSSGEYVTELQFLLDYISQFYDFLPVVLRTSVFGENTRTAVMEFQRNFGLVVDGIVGTATWQKLYSVFWSLQESVRGVAG